MTKIEVKPLQRYYKGVILVKAYEELNKTGDYTKKELDDLFKYLCGVELSTTKMDLEQIKTLCEWSLFHCQMWNINVDYPQDELDKLISI